VTDLIFEVYMYQVNKDINYFNNRDFQMGYDAHSLGEYLDKTKSQEWQMGWHEWENDMTRSENQSYY